MRKRISKILVTGGAGFIGSAFVRSLLSMDNSLPGQLPDAKVVVIDKLTYAGDLERLKEVEGEYKFYKVDISNKRKIESIFSKERPEFIVHFAAESHVDRSIKDATLFIDTNIKGTHILLDAARKYKVKRFIHISTDEVYGDIKKGRFCEDSPLRPNSPYAVSKAAADLLVKAYIRTYGFPAIIIRPSNNYGPWQYPEKLIPLAILRILGSDKVPVYGKGHNVREWLYVDDCVRGILTIMNKGKIGQVYNLGSGQEKRNIDTVKLLLKILGVNQNGFTFVKDRLGHDIRYSLNSKKLYQKLAWKPQLKFLEGLKVTAAWLIKHQLWLKSKLKDINKLYK